MSFHHGGFPYSAERRPLLSFLHIYCDESGKHESDPVICFGALCIRAEALSDFDSKWRGLLRQYSMEELHMMDVSRLSQNIGSKFQTGQSADERMELLKPFADCINEFMETSMCHTCDSAAFASIPTKTKNALAGMKDPYHMAFMRGLEEVSQYGGQDQLAIIFDDDEKTAPETFRLYRALRLARSSVREKVKSLSFADSITFPALQAADMASYLGRREGLLRWYSHPYEMQDLLRYMTTDQAPGKMQWKVAWFGKEQLKNAKNWGAA